MKVAAIIPAAGMGTRFIPGSNKPFYSLLGRPMLLWTLDAVSGVSEISEIIIAVKPSDMIETREILNRAGLRKPVRIAEGGRQRQDSVYNCLKLLGGDTDIVVIHDGARPLVTAKIISESIRALTDSKEIDGTIAAVPPKDTIKESGPDGSIARTPDRKGLWSVQTPQVFRYATILKAYDEAAKAGYYSTDDSALVERMGGRVIPVMGSYENIKITTPEDVLIAEAIMGRRRSE